MRLLPALILVLPTLAEAQEVDCYNSTTQMELTSCAEQDWMAADADLNEAYGVAMSMMEDIDADLPEDQQGAASYLRDGQRAWITFRDATCAAEGYKVHGGSMEPMIIYLCWARLTQVRAKDLWMITEPY